MSVDLIRSLTNTQVIDEKGQVFEIPEGRTFRINKVQPSSKPSDKVIVLFPEGRHWRVINKDWGLSTYTFAHA